MASKTGNICVEEKAINHSKSSVIVYLVDGIFYFFKRNQLLLLIKNRRYKKSVLGGDQKHKLFLFGKE